MVNKVQLIGNLGQDPELKKTDTTTIAKFSLATSERFKNKQGEAQENTEWHNVVAFGKLAEIIDKWLKKGSKVFIEGKIATRSYDDKEGNKKYFTEIIAKDMVMLGEKQSTQGDKYQHHDENAPYSGNPKSGGDDLDF